jgi:ketosteroid isomerase-like protein
MLMAVLAISTLDLQAQTEHPASKNLEVVQKIHTSLDSGDLPTILALMDENMVWNEAEHFPYADGNPYIGPDAVAEGVLSRLRSDREYFKITHR